MFKRMLFALLMLAVRPPAFSQQLDFTATLDSIRIQARPGQIVNRRFSLTLSAQAKRTQFRSSVSDWWQSEDGYQSFYAESGTLARSCGEWVALNPVEAAVGPSETLDIRVSVAVPANAEPGGFWCALTVDQLPDPTQPPDGDVVEIRFLASVSTGIFIYIDPVKREGRITNVEILAEESKVTVLNEGNIPLGVEGRFEFVRPGEEKPAAVVLIPRRTVLPEPVRTAILSAKLPDATALPSGTYLVKAILDIGLEHYIGVQRRLEVQR